MRRGGTVAPSNGKDTEFIRVNVPHEDNVNVPQTQSQTGERAGEGNRPAEATAGRWLMVTPLLVILVNLPC